MAHLFLIRKPSDAAGGSSGGGTHLWDLDEASTVVDGNGALLFGWTSRWGTQTTPPTFDDYTLAKIAASGPASQDALRFTYGAIAAQAYLGGEVTLTAPAFGVSRYFGGHIRINCLDYPNDIHTCKHMIIADQAANNRPILVWGGRFGADPDYEMWLQLDGGGNVIKGPRFGNNVWHRWEIELYPGNTASDTNGYYKIWAGPSSVTFTYASPSDSTSGLSFAEVQRAQWGDIRLGFYHNDSVATADLTVDICDNFAHSSFVP